MSDYNQFLLQFLFDLRYHFFKENFLNNIYKHIRWTTLDLPIDPGTHLINNKDNTSTASTTNDDDDDDDDNNDSDNDNN